MRHRRLCSPLSFTFRAACQSSATIQRGSFKSWLRVVTRSRISVYWRAKKAGEKLNRESLPGNEDISVVEQIPDPASDALDEVWQREWQENLMNTAMRRVRSKVASQQLLIFRTTALGRLSSGQVAKKLGVKPGPSVFGAASDG